jgi:hypothetical protein
MSSYWRNTRIHKKYVKCDKELTYFNGYIPDSGDAYMKCWVEYMKKEEIKK